MNRMCLIPKRQFLMSESTYVICIFVLGYLIDYMRSFPLFLCLMCYYLYKCNHLFDLLKLANAGLAIADLVVDTKWCHRK